MNDFVNETFVVSIDNLFFFLPVYFVVKSVSF